VGKLTIIYWRDIPAQVIGQQGRTRHKKVLDGRFAVAIDRAAMRAGKGSSHAYLDEWRREGRSFEGDLQAAVEAEVARLEAQFSAELLEATVKAGGLIKDKT
jgi:hypothetical protein